MRHSRRYDFQGHPRSGSRWGDDLSPLLGLFYSSCSWIEWHTNIYVQSICVVLLSNFNNKADCFCQEHQTDGDWGYWDVIWLKYFYGPAICQNFCSPTVELRNSKLSIGSAFVKNEVSKLLLKRFMALWTLSRTTQVRWYHTHTHTHTHTHNGFTALWILSGTTQVSWYQKKHSPTYTYRGHQSSLICFLHLLWSMTSSLFNLPFGLEPPISYSIHFFTE